jgi:hypothetical protein
VVNPLHSGGRPLGPAHKSVGQNSSDQTLQRIGCLPNVLGVGRRSRRRRDRVRRDWRSSRERTPTVDEPHTTPKVNDNNPAIVTRRSISHADP